MSDNRPNNGTAGFVFAAIFNALMLVVVNGHATWRPWLHGLVTPAWADALWAMNLGGLTQVAGNMLLAFTHPPWLKKLMDLVFSVTGFVGAYVMYRVFPFHLQDLWAWAPSVARALLLVGVFGTAIAIVVNLVRLFIPTGGGRRRAAHP